MKIIKKISKQITILGCIILMCIINCYYSYNNVFAITTNNDLQLMVDNNFNITNNQSIIVPIRSDNDVHMISFSISNFVGLIGIDLNNKSYYNSDHFKYEIIKSGNDYKFYLIDLTGSSLNKNGIVVELVLNVGVTNKNNIVKLKNIYVNDKFINELQFQINNPDGIGDNTTPVISGGGGGGVYGMFNFNKNQDSKLTKSDIISTSNLECRDEYIVDIDGHWAKDIIIDLKNKCIISGFGTNKKNKKFYPDLPIYRAEAVKMLLKAKKINIDSNVTDSGFTDVLQDSPYFIYITKAKELGIIDGYQDGTFRPKDFITRSQALKILALTSDINKEKLNNKDYSNAYKKYIDVSPLFWDISYINYFTAINFIQGYIDKTFRPNGHITRAEFAKLVHKLYKD